MSVFWRSFLGSVVIYLLILPFFGTWGSANSAKVPTSAGKAALSPKMSTFGLFQTENFSDPALCGQRQFDLAVDPLANGSLKIAGNNYFTFWNGEDRNSEQFEDPLSKNCMTWIHFSKIEGAERNNLGLQLKAETKFEPSNCSENDYIDLVLTISNDKKKLQVDQITHSKKVPKPITSSCIWRRQDPAVGK